MVRALQLASRPPTKGERREVVVRVWLLVRVRIEHDTAPTLLVFPSPLRRQRLAGGFACVGQVDEMLTPARDAATRARADAT